MVLQGCTLDFGSISVSPFLFIFLMLSQYFSLIFSTRYSWHCVILPGVWWHATSPWKTKVWRTRSYSIMATCPCVRCSIRLRFCVGGITSRYHTCVHIDHFVRLPHGLLFTPWMCRFLSATKQYQLGWNGFELDLQRKNQGPTTVSGWRTISRTTGNFAQTYPRYKLIITPLDPSY